MKIYFSAGEPSGDLHGANLIRELRRRQPDLEAVGYGGPEMASAGCRLEADLTTLAVMWILRALLNLHKFLALLSRADRFFRREKPDAVVLIDFPGFNWWIARRAKAHGIPVFYYAPPQVWAWANWRVKKMRRYVDHVLCSLPFEARWFAERGCNATFVGHPYFDEVRRQQPDPNFIKEHADAARPLVAILPGSRTQEVEGNLETMLAAAVRVAAQVPRARFAIASFKPGQARMARHMVEKLCDEREKTNQPPLDIEVFTRRTPELIRLADCCLAVSGSVSLELLYHAKPTVILYRVSPLAFRIQARFRRVKYITLVNLLACDDADSRNLAPYNPAEDRSLAGASTTATADTAQIDTAQINPAQSDSEVLFPEYLTCQDCSAQLAEHLVTWLTDRAARQALVDRLQTFSDRVGHGGASSHAADYILTELAKRQDPIPQPHFLPTARPTYAQQDAA